MADEPDTAAESKPAGTAAANRQGREGDPNPVYRTQADLDAQANSTFASTPGTSHSPGLTEIDGSEVPGDDGRKHVVGPTQSPVDPVAAGLDPKGLVKPEPAQTDDLNIPRLGPGPTKVEPGAPPEADHHSE
jgi:hypothetical protein